MQQTLVFDFDSLEQKSAFRSLVSDEDLFCDPTAGGSPEGKVSFPGMLRAADLLSREILLLDVHLLDGAFFLSRGPAAVRTILARTASFDQTFAVVAREASLEESLRALLLGNNSSSPVLTEFEFSSLSMYWTSPVHLGRVLKTRSSERLRSCAKSEVARTVAAELQAAWESADPGHHIQTPTGHFAALAAAWESWFEEASAGHICVRTWGSNVFSFEAALQRRPYSGPTPDGVPEVGDAVASLQRIKRRTSALSYLEEHARHLTGCGEALEDWWMSVYFDALARQHGTNWLRFSDDKSLKETGRRTWFRRRSGVEEGDAPIQFQGSLVATLHDMPPQAYAVMRHQARQAIREWQDSPSQKTSDGLAYAVAQSNMAVSLFEDRKAMWRRIGLTVFPAAVGALTGGLLSNLIVGVGSAIATVVLGVPLVEFAELHETRKKKMRAHIHFPAAPH
ncbi:hypothetical protein [Arthrobacter gengyunqii]|uniref:Uncharacterized protein n=1 Tax=Arthrobacter gengyunqii TaxID=2886940 RepID=A0ABS8GEI8_9MICC|nr:hypothetical protein [Arthrobacter gengyunqii]MCC3265030.1 hypothetical protein [Arthrobacter gengyunqii]